MTIEDLFARPTTQAEPTAIILDVLQQNGHMLGYTPEQCEQYFIDNAPVNAAGVDELLAKVEKL